MRVQCNLRKIVHRNRNEETVKFQVNREVFADAVTWVARTIPNRPAIPVLAGLKITAAADGVVTLASRDSDITSHMEFDAAVDDAGEVLVNGKLLAEISRNLPNKPIEISLNERKVEIECGSAHFSLKTMPLDEYTEPHQLPALAGVVDGTQWQEAVSQVTVAASNDDTLPMLVSVCLEISGSEISLMATDRYRLAVRDITWTPEDSTINKRILVRGSRLLDLARSLGTAGPINIYLDDDNSGLIGFAAGGKQSVVQLTDGDYPQVRTLFPAEVNGYASINRSELLDAIKRSRVVVEKNTSVLLSFSEEQLVIEAGHGDAAQASEVLPATLTGDDISLAFNPSYLQEGINSMNSENVRLSFTLSSKPAILTPEDDEGVADDSFRVLLMPIRMGGVR